MKACIIQPPYSRDVSYADDYFQYKLDLLDHCDGSLDIIVLPEYSDVPCVTETLEETLYYHEKYIHTLLNRCIETAKRCNAMVFVNALSKEETGYRNTTYAFDRCGNLAGKYFKKHLPPLEMEVLKLDRDYTFQQDEPYVLEMEGLRFGFLTCYDFYFYEAFANIAREQVDIIIGCSLQRSDSHDAIEIMCRFLAYNTNAYVIRSSVSFSEESDICGASMIVSPKGQVLVNMKGAFGKAEAVFDPNEKYYKPAGFGNPDAPHYAYIEYGRRPWQYRAAGPTIVPFDRLMKYPRICAYRGFDSIADENSMPAFGSAIALGADEIAFDITGTKDGALVSCQGNTLDGNDEASSILFEDILKKFAGHTIMNIHVIPGEGPCSPNIMKEVVSLVRRYDCARHVYFTLEREEDIRMFRRYAPDISICVGYDLNAKSAVVDRAIELGAQKVQFVKPYVNRKMVDKAHACGIVCNLFPVENKEEMRYYLEMGIDTILARDHKIML